MSNETMRVGGASQSQGLSFEMASAILIYKNTGVGGTHGAGTALVSLHDVRHDEKRKIPVIAPGKLCDHAALKNLLRDIAGHATSHRELLPETLLFADSTQLLWFSPPRREVIYFSTADKDFNRDVTSKVVAHPALLFQATPGALRVLALGSFERPGPASKVFVAPYCNLYEGGAMCRGDVSLPPTLLPATIPAWERVFFDSRFTHSNLNGPKLTSFAGGHNALWRAMVRADSFPPSALTKTKWTVDHVLNSQLK